MFDSQMFSNDNICILISQYILLLLKKSLNSLFKMIMNIFLLYYILLYLRQVNNLFFHFIYGYKKITNLTRNQQIQASKENYSNGDL